MKEYEEISFQLDYIKKGKFCESLPTFEETKNITEWQYTSADGEAVLLVSGDSKALILADFEGCFLAVTTENRDGRITEAVLQELTDQIHFKELEDMAAHKQSQRLRLPGVDKVSLSGLSSSREARAFAEWNDYLDGYDMEAAVGNGNSVFIAEGREDWSFYEVYSYEMGEKLDAVADKYGLKLHTEMNVISPEELEYRVGGNFMKDCTKYWGYIYEDGTFSFEGDAELEGCGTTDFQFERSVKGTFGNVMLYIGQQQDYEEWQYLSAGSEPVLLALSSSKSLIFADFEDCFISVNVLLGSDMGMTKKDLQELVDKIDFTVLKNVRIPDMRGDSIPEDTLPANDPENQTSEPDAEIRELMTGGIEGLGMGCLAYVLPDKEDEDYKLCFFSAKSNSADTDADYIFPDVRNDNVSPGRFVDIYFFDMVERTGTDKSDLIVIARYESEGKTYYDTRAYVWNENAWCVDEELMRELNEKYTDAEEYPIAELFQMPHD